MATFGASGGFGSFTGWDLVSANYTEQSERAQAFSKTGNESDSELYDKRKNWTATYKANKNLAAGAAPTIPANIGAEVEGILLTSISISTTFNDFATMTLTGHEHVDGTDGTDTLRSVAHGITLSAGFGSSAFGVTGGDSVESSSVTISCDHAESKDANGDTSAGENHNPRIEINVTAFGTTLAAPATYDEVSNDQNTDNQGFVHSSISVIKALAFTET